MLHNIETVLILDFGSQVTQLIARRIREAHVYCEVHPFSINDDLIQKINPKAIILSGGPASVHDKDAPHVRKKVFDLGVPVLGICYGQQEMVLYFGGQIAKREHVSLGGEFGRADLTVVQDSPLFKGVWEKGSSYPVWMSHGDHVNQLPEGFKAIATSPGAPYAMIADETKKLYGVQFHPEVAHTPRGEQIIENFVVSIAGCKKNWSMADYRDEMIEKIRIQVGREKVVCGLSGGVDSSVAAVLLHEAIGKQLTCIYVDTGLMRAGESEQVETLFKDHYDIPFVRVEASELFLKALKGVEDPEKKRKIIGKLFIDIFEQEAKKIGRVKFLAQGTLYPDVIESVSISGGPSVTIKSHHNVGGLPQRMKLKLIEPLRELFKDEVRVLGKELGLPDIFIDRHPFPGPGLAIRLPGAVTKERADILRQADKIYVDALREEGLYDEIWQAFAVLLPVKTVGVMGDGRTYDYVCGLRAVTSVDGMTADTYPFSHDFLSRISTRIINQVKGINRVVYDITSKPPGTIEWE